MNINVTIALSSSDEINMTTEEVAHAVLAALGGDPNRDTVLVQATAPTAVIGVGATPPVLPEPVPEPIPIEPVVEPEPVPVDPIPEPPARG